MEREKSEFRKAIRGLLKEMIVVWIRVMTVIMERFLGGRIKGHGHWLTTELELKIVNEENTSVKAWNTKVVCGTIY